MAKKKTKKLTGQGVRDAILVIGKALEMGRSRDRYGFAHAHIGISANHTAVTFDTDWGPDEVNEHVSLDQCIGDMLSPGRPRKMVLDEGEDE